MLSLHVSLQVGEYLCRPCVNSRRCDRGRREFTDMFVEITRVLSATVQCVVNPQPAAKAASQRTRFLSSRAIKGSRLQRGAMVTRRELPLLRQLFKQPCPNREGNALLPTD